MSRKNYGGVLGNTWSTTTTTITNHESVVTNGTNGTNIPIFFSTTVSEKDITFEHVYGIWITRFGISVLVMSTLA